MDAASHRHKQRVALSSLLAAVGLTAFKMVVGLLTGSLGILAEAAHSGLDLAAAGATWFAVRMAARPADEQHLYGHGKVENLSALFEAALLVATCAWIVWAALGRLIYGGVEVRVTAWSYIAMATSIMVDASRSRALGRAARAYNSQALEADALHFKTDIWSSAVVIVGLICVRAGQTFPAAAWLRNADAVAAIGVAGIALLITVRLGVRTVMALLDTAPMGMGEQIARAAESVPGVMDCHRVRLRYSGSQLFVDAHVLLDGEQTLRRAHAITEDVEIAIRRLAPEADVTVHPEPPETGRL